MKRRSLVLACLLIAASVLVSCTNQTTVSSESESGEFASQSSEDASEINDDKSEISESEENSNPSESDLSEQNSEEDANDEIKVSDASGDYYISKSVNVRSGPSTDYEKIATLNKYDKITVNGIADNGWYRFEINGKYGFVSNSFIIDEATCLAMKQAEQDALEAAIAEAAAKEAEKAAAERAAAEAAALQQANANSGNSKADVVALINNERAAIGIGGVASDSSLDALAQIRAQEIVSTFSHTRPDGRPCFSVFDDGGIVYSAAGENIAAGYASASDVMSGWMESPGHRANILNASYGKVGIGLYTVPGDAYTYYWVQLFTN